MLTRDALDGTRPVEAHVASVAGATAMFDDLTYVKGAAVVRSVEEAIGHEAFRAGLRRFVATHAFASADGDDLWRALSLAAPGTLLADAQHWLRTRAHPLIRIDAQCAGPQLRITLHQETEREGSPVALPDGSRPVELAVHIGDGATTLIRLGKRPRTILGRAGDACPSYSIGRRRQPLRLRYTGRAPAPPGDTASTLAELDDAWAAVRRGEHSTAWFLSRLPARSGRDSAVDYDILRRLRFIAEELLATTDRPAFAGQVARVLPQVELGSVLQRAGEDDPRLMHALLDARGSSLLQQLADALSASPPERRFAWRFFVSHFDHLVARLPRIGYGRLVRALSSFCDDHERQQVHSFFELRAHFLPGSTDSVRSTEEEIANCTALQRRESSRLAAWLHTARK